MHHGAGTWELPPPGGTPDAALLGLRVPSCNTTQLCLTGSTSRKRGAEECEEGLAAPIGDDRGRPYRLIRFSTLLLAQSLPRKGFFSTALLAGLHIEAMLLDFLDDVFLLHFALETAQSVLQGLSFLDDDFSHVKFTPNPVRIGNLRCRCLRCTAHGHYRMQSAYVHEHVDRIMGHLVVNSGIRCQVIFVKRGARREIASVSAVYVLTGKDSKVLDLVGIRSILR